MPPSVTAACFLFWWGLLVSRSTLPGFCEALVLGKEQSQQETWNGSLLLDDDDDEDEDDDDEYIFGTKCPDAMKEAVQMDDVKALQDLLTADPELRDCKLLFTEQALKCQVGGTPLHYAAGLDKLRVLIFLLEQGFDCSAKTFDVPLDSLTGLPWPKESTALMIAASNGRLEVVKRLLDCKRSEVNAQNREGLTALMIAAKHQQEQVVEALLKVQGIDVNLQSKEGKTALMYAALYNMPQAIALFSSAKSLELNLQDMDGRTALMLAARSGHSAVVRELIVLEGIDIHVIDQDGMDALMLAITHGYGSVVSTLTAVGGFDVWRLNKAGNNILHLAVAARENRLGIVRIILNRVKSKDSLNVPRLVNSVSEITKRTALQIATSQPEPQSDVVQCLLSNNATVYNRDKDHKSALWWAVKRGCYIITKTLLEYGASLRRDIDKDDFEGNHLALWIGVEYSLSPLVQFLANTEDSWRLLWLPPRACIGEMKGRCTQWLLLHAKTAAIVHELLDWQDRADQRDSSSPKTSSIHSTTNRLWGSSTQTTQQIREKILEIALTEDLSEIALGLLSRGVGESLSTEDRVKILENALNSSVVLPSEEHPSESNIPIPLTWIWVWNRLHWSAFACDANALNLALLFTTQDLVDLLDECPVEGGSQTPFAVAKLRQHECLRAFAVFQVLQKSWTEQYVHRITTACLVCWACIGSHALHLFVLRLMTLRKRGWLVMSWTPILLCGLGIGLVGWSPKSVEGHVTPTKIRNTVGWTALVAGVLLLIGVTAVCLSERTVEFLQHLKKKGNQKLDRFWEKLNCALGCLIAFALILEALHFAAMNIYVRGIPLVAGIAHTMAVAGPLLLPIPVWFMFLLRLLPGLVISVDFAIYALRSGQPLKEYPAPPEGLIIIATCICFAWVDLSGVAAKAAWKVSGIVQIELVRKQYDDKFAANKLVLGHAASAAHGLEAVLGLTTAQISEGLKDPIEAMRKEVSASGDRNDLENFLYIVEGISGRPSDFPTAVATSLETGFYHGGHIEPTDFDTGHNGRSLEDWMRVDEVVLAKLTEAEFVAVRFYTSSSFSKINGPLRTEVRPHPWAMVVLLLDRGIKKLRSVQAQVNPQAFAGETTLWRGMKNLAVDIDEFAQVGGTEMAPMSTTTNEEVARHYAASKAPLVFKYVVGGLKTGVSIQFLSLYPKEEEFLYAPITFLSLKGHYEDDGTTILVVEPVMS